MTGKWFPRLVKVNKALARLDEYQENILGSSELQTILEMNQSTFSMRIKNGSNLPPYTRSACGPIWRKSTVRNWLNGLK